MKIGCKILVTKTIAEGLKANPAHVQECLREAEATMNVTALERKRIVSDAPRLRGVQDSALGKDLVELEFIAPTRAI